jgi:uncharacterized protein
MNELPPVALSNDRTWVILSHLIALTLFIGIPFGNVIGPLVIWLLKKHESTAVDINAKESLNFQISMTIYTLLAGLSCFVFIGFVLLPLVLLANAILVVIASIKASNGEAYRYPLNIRFIA